MESSNTSISPKTSTDGQVRKSQKKGDTA